MCWCVHSLGCVCRSETNLKESFLSFHHCGPCGWNSDGQAQQPLPSSAKSFLWSALNRILLPLMFEIRIKSSRFCRGVTMHLCHCTLFPFFFLPNCSIPAPVAGPSLN